jgi:hypothetical protein
MQMMTDEQIKDFIEYFEGLLPDPETYPKTFTYYVKLYMYIHKIK